MRRPVDGHDAVLLDLDGVVFVGDRAVDGAAQTISGLRAEGISVVFVTNNASRTAAEVAAHLTKLGVAADAADVVTSAQAAARVLGDGLAAGDPVLVLGTAALVDEVRAVGLTPVTTVDEGPVAVVNGFDPTMTYDRLAEAALALRAGAWWVATNTDACLPAARGLMPGNGASVAFLATATDRTPDVAGKPSASVFHVAAERVGAHAPLVVGDRPDTDIAGARAAGMRSAAVLSGVATPGMLVCAPAVERPDLVLAALPGLVTPTAEVSGLDGTGWCGQAVVSVSAGSPVVEESGSSVDIVRAALAAAWSLPAGPLDTDAFDRLLS